MIPVTCGVSGNFPTVRSLWLLPPAFGFFTSSQPGSWTISSSGTTGNNANQAADLVGQVVLKIRRSSASYFNRLPSDAFCTANEDGLHDSEPSTVGHPKSSRRVRQISHRPVQESKLDVHLTGVPPERPDLLRRPTGRSVGKVEREVGRRGRASGRVVRDDAAEVDHQGTRFLIEQRVLVSHF